MATISARPLFTEAPETTSRGVSIIVLEAVLDPVRLWRSWSSTSTRTSARKWAQIQLQKPFESYPGRGSFLADNRELLVRAGDWMLEPNVQHQLRNESTEVLSGLSISWAAR